MNYTWITQGSFLLESDGFRLAVDPYMSDFVEQKEGLTRIKDPAFTVETLKPDGVFFTHNHIDHFDPVSIPEVAKQYPECIYAGPVSILDKCKEANVDMAKVTKIELGQTVKLGPFALTALPAIHSDKDAVGVLVEVENKKIFISGDSQYTEEYTAKIADAAKGADLALICINGRLGNMNDEEALKVIEAVAPKQALPMHYGLFEENTADPTAFIDGCKKLGIESFAMEQGSIYQIW